MKKLNALLVIIALLSVASCIDATPRDSTPRATPGIPAYQRIINSGIGKPVTRLIDQWGPPARTFTLAGKEYIVYVFESTITQGGSPGSRFQSGTSGYSYDVTDCTYTFEIRRGTIVGGNAVDGRKGGCARRAE